MSRRGERPSDLKVRISHEATRLSAVHVAAAFERLVPIPGRRTRPACAEGDARWADAQSATAKPMKGR